MEILTNHRSAIPTTVASSDAIDDPRMVATSTHAAVRDPYARPGSLSDTGVRSLGTDEARESSVTRAVPDLTTTG